MAVTKLLRLKESRKGNASAHLKANLFYICNPDKCQGGLYIGGNAGTSPQIIYETMMENKRFFGKTDGSQGFHYVISFPPDLNVSADLAYQIAEDFAYQLLGDEYYYAFAVHNDQHHMHVHITFDSVCKRDGRKFHSPKGDWEKRIQPITDEICRKYDLPALEFTGEKKGKSYGQWKSDQKEKEGKIRTDVSWYDLIRDDIDQAVSSCATFEEFLEKLSDSGYEIRLGKYLSLRPYGKERAVRSSRLGSAYTIDAIRERLLKKDQSFLDQDFVRYGNREEILTVLRIKKAERRSYVPTPFQRAYLRRWNNSFLRSKPGRKDPWKVNADVIRIRKLSDAVKFMIDEDIDDLDALEKTYSDLQKRKKVLKDQKSFLSDKLYRRSPVRELLRYEKILKESKGSPTKEQMQELSHLLEKMKAHGGMQKARQELSICREGLLKIRLEMKEVSAKEKLIDDLYTFYFDMPRPEQAREKETEKKAKWQEERVRVTIHKKLIIRKETDGSYLVKLPGLNRLLRLGAEDTYLYKSGEILSAFLYDDEDYEVFDMDEKVLGREKGETIKTLFTRQKDRVREKGR